MLPLRGLWLLLFCLCAGLGCASVKGDGPAGSGASSGDVGASGGSSPTGTGGRGGTGDEFVPPDGGFFVADVSTDCARLNIGILGNPGSNASSNFQSWLEARGTSVQRIQTTPDVPLTADALKPFDVVVLDLPAREYTADEASIFGVWVAAGGGVAAMSGYHDDTSQDWRANSLLSQLGLAYSGQRIWGPVMQFANHPITVGLTSVTFTGGYPVADLGGTGTRTPIAFIPANGDEIPVAYVAEMGAGKAFVWGDEWIEFDSEWSSLPQIPKLWLQIFAWIAPPGNHCALIGIG
jgi:hypothetical protein